MERAEGGGAVGGSDGEGKGLAAQRGKKERRWASEGIGRVIC